MRAFQRFLAHRDLSNAGGGGGGGGGLAQDARGAGFFGLRVSEGAGGPKSKIEKKGKPQDKKSKP